MGQPLRLHLYCVECPASLKDPARYSNRKTLASHQEERHHIRRACLI